VIISRNSRAIVLQVALVAPFLSCGHSNNPPTGVTPSSTLAPAPSPTPTPTPSVATSCANLPTTSGACGSRPDPQLATAIAQAEDFVKNQTDIFYPDGVTVRYLDKARAQLLYALDTKGICGIFDFGDGTGNEMWVRSADGNLSEVYAVISSSGQLRVGYQHSCGPPEPPPPVSKPTYPQIDAACRLPPSGATFCLGQNVPSDYSDDVRASLVSLTTERPDLFDLTDHLLCDLCYRLMDPKAYIAAMIDKMHAKGYCAMEDEELAVKKDDSVGENFNIVRAPGDNPHQYSLFSYKGRCHNASF
jgi:hypothetical protein